MAVLTTIATAVAKRAGLEVCNAAKEAVRARQAEKAQQACDDLVHQVAIVAETDPEGAVARIEAILREAQPGTEETMYEHFRSHMDAVPRLGVRAPQQVPPAIVEPPALLEPPSEHPGRAAAVRGTPVR